ncbi:MAG: hypothetical protein ACLQBL_33165, partial [Polyangiaceae bacterium]
MRRALSFLPLAPLVLLACAHTEPGVPCPATPASPTTATASGAASASGNSVVNGASTTAPVQT